MKIRLLGTGGADGIPALCAKSPVSDFARQNGGKDVRTRAAALIDDELKIDLGPDTLMQIQRDGIDPCDWTAVLFTHSDEDHLAPGELQYFLYPFNDNEHLPFTIYGNDVVLAQISGQYPGWPMDLRQSTSFSSFEHADYRITPVQANHKCNEDAQNFLIERDGRKVIYATDTGVWSDQTFEHLRGSLAHGLVIECTEGFHKSDYCGHLDIADCVGMVQRMRQLDILGNAAKIVTTHHSHQGGARHCDLVQALGPFAIDVGYDGMEFEV